jgi:hypothetical protein
VTATKAAALNERGMHAVIGFDTTAPAVIADFVRSWTTERFKAAKEETGNNAGGGEELPPVLSSDPGIL